jgi:hypothetical protein
VLNFVEVVKCFSVMIEERIKIILIFGIVVLCIYKNPDVVGAWPSRWHPWYLLHCVQQKQHMVTE